MTSAEMEPFNLIAAFAGEEDREEAVAELHGSGFRVFETYSPMPTHETGSSTPRVTLVAGLIGIVGGFSMQAYANAIGYPLDIGGRPKFSWPSFVPIAFEIGMGFAVIVATVAAFIFEGLFRLHDPIDDEEPIGRAMSDRWLLALHASNRERLHRAEEICRRSGATEIQEARSWAGGR